MTDKEKKAAEEVAKTEAKATEETTTEEVVEEVKEKKAGSISKSSAVKYAGKGAKKYEKPKAPKFKGNKLAPPTVEKKGKKYVGRGLVHFVSNGKTDILGPDGTAYETPADRAQKFVDGGLGEITGIVEVKPKKKGH